MSLLINGRTVDVPGVQVIGPHQMAYSYLSPGDCQPRDVRPQLYVLHRTLADDPDSVLDGKGPPGGAERTAGFWANDPRHSGAHLVTGHDGVVACLADLARVTAYHAGNNVVNSLSVGHETCEMFGGRMYRAALEATVETCLTACFELGIQWQMPRLGDYNGHPYKRLEYGGGRNVVGIIGHRDVSEQRGRWDPGDVVFEMLAARGVEQFNIAQGEDISVWRDRQTWLKQLGWYEGNIDGIPGALTVAALKLAGFPSGIWARHRETVERLLIPEELLR